MSALASMYRPGYATVLTYMLHNTAYRSGRYLRWFWRTQNFDAVIRGRPFAPTRSDRLVRFMLRTGMFLQFSVGAALLVQWLWQGYKPGWQFGLALILSYPIIWAHLVTVPLALGRWLIIDPLHRLKVRRSAMRFGKHQAIKVAVVGSHGAPVMKELLKTVLSEGRKVAAVPSGRDHDALVRHADFVRRLAGDEDILILDYGTEKPGGIRRFARQTHPTHAVITGLAPTHPDRRHSLERSARDLFSVARYVDPSQIYLNAEDRALKPYLNKEMHKFKQTGGLGWKVKDVVIGQDGTGVSFRLTKRRHSLSLQSGLIGHQAVAPLAFVAAFALKLGLTEEQVIAGIAKTQPLEHHMQPLRMSGALVIDDTSNRDLEGVRIGTALLAELPAERKWYITPGLTDTGHDAAKLHHQLGEMIAAASPDVVVLTNNTVEQYIEAGLSVGGFDGELRVENDPLEFYDNLPHFLAAGDVVLMQNDWTEHYH